MAGVTVFGQEQAERKAAAPSVVQRRYLQAGMAQPGGKLPLFDQNGQRIKDATIRACLKNGWCEPWYHNPVKPDWLVCKLTPAGRSVVKPAKRGRDA